MRLYVGLVHYPVYNKQGQRIVSAITTFDLHDLSRVARTYGVKKFFVINPLQDQQRLARRVLAHWVTGHGAAYNPHRKEAILLAEVVSSLQEAVDQVRGSEGEAPLIIATDAAPHPDKGLGYSEAAQMLDAQRVVLLLFGTAWGLGGEMLRRADYVLAPVRGAEDYNHLSVRSAAAIILDRLAGRYNGARTQERIYGRDREH